MDKTIIVTGAAGFIGCNTVRALNARGITDLLLVDQLGTDDKWKNLRGLEFDDIISPDEFLDRVEDDRLPELEAIIHLGACSATTEKDADYLLENNTHTTQTLCEYALASDVRFVYASSAATYGDGSLGYSDDDSVTPTLRPLNMYGYSKHLFDLWALRHGYLDRIVGLKYFNVFGPFEDHKGEMRSVVQKAFHQIKDSGRVSLFKSYLREYGDGEQKRDFVYVKDAVDVTVHFALDRSHSGLFNVGGGVARTWIDLANAVFAAMGKPPQIDFIEMPETLRGKYQYFTQADATKLKAAGYGKTFMSLEDAARDYVQNYMMTQSD